MHRARDLLVKQRTQLVNMIRGLLAEFGINIPKGLERALLMARRIVDDEAPDVPIEAAKIVGTLSQQALDIHVRLRQIDRDLLVWQRGNDVGSTGLCKRWKPLASASCNGVGFASTLGGRIAKSLL